MIYLITGIVAITAFLNLKASLLIVRSPLCEKQRKAIQLIFVWLVPFMGALLATQILSNDSTRYAGQAWPYPGEYILYPPDDCGDIQSHHHGDGCD